MRRVGAVASLLLVLVAPDRSAAQTTTFADVEALAEVVRAREIAFAKTMADRDLDAFAGFVSHEAIFFGQSGAQRGREAIVAAWAPYYEGESVPFSWHPDTVEVLDSGTLALSSGPVRDPDGNEVGRFNSIWRLEDDGVWRVIFDRGS